MIDTDVRPSRRTLVGLCLAMGGSLTVAASFNYLLTPMLDDLGLTQEQAGVALSIPPIASLLVVFLAGQLGDRRGHRAVITWMSISFIAGSALVAIAPGLSVVVIGLLLEGVAATAIQIITFGLLSDRFSEPRARAAAFGTFGMVSPFVWLVFPVVTGAVVGQHSWRLVPAVWVVAGFVILCAARWLLPAHEATSALGELWTPALAGLTVVLGVQALNSVGADGLVSPQAIVRIIATVASATACLVLLRRLPRPSFSLAPLRDGRARSLLGVVIIIPLINTVFFMTLIFQYLYGLTVLQTALAMVPAQACAVLGTRYVAGPMMRRWGVTRTATIFFLVLVPVMLASFFVTADSPLWVPIAYVTAYNVLTVAASITVTSGVLSTASEDDSGMVAAYRGSAVSLGAVLAVVLMNGLVFTLGQLFLTSNFEEQGLSAADAASLSAQVQSTSTTANPMSQYSMPLPSGVPVNDVMQDSLAAGLHINGVAGAILALGAAWLVMRSARSRVRSGSRSGA